MPKIMNYTPPWLSRPSPGSQAFTAAPDHASGPLKFSSHLGSSDHEEGHRLYNGPHRLLAQRGTEVFVVVGNQIRWLDLHLIKDDWEDKTRYASKARDLLEHQDGSKPSPYRILVAPVYQQIRQLIISPSGNFLAILTEHTVHIAILPDPSHLATGERSPLKIKTHQLGPTTHVLPQSPVVSALWHPLAYSTTSLDCLITITAEAAVRVWELDSGNTWSFDRPSLAIDLPRLADGTSCDEDFEPSGFGKSKGFSADTFEMEVSAACFGGQGREEEDGWSSMTLWIAMRNADVYALCPLLPSKWRAMSTVIPALSTSVVSKIACLGDDSVQASEKRAAEQQYEWVQEIDGEEPMPTDSDLGPSVLGEARSRPMAPSAIPRLQGPFLFHLGEDDLDVDVSDIHVTAARVNAEDLLSGEDEDYIDLEGRIQDRLSSTVIALASKTGKVHIGLELEGVSGQWLPKSRRSAFTIPAGEPKDLALIESVQIGNGGVDSADSRNWPLFSRDAQAPYDFYLTSLGRIDYLSLSAWASRLASELLSPVVPDTGRDFRLKVLCRGDIVLTEEILDFPDDSSQKSMDHLSAAVVTQSQEIGYFLLACSALGPHAVTFDRPGTVSRSLILARTRTNSLSSQSSRPQPIDNFSEREAMTSPPRATYEPSPVFYISPTAPLRQFLSLNVPQRHKAALKQEIRLSPSTLDIMTEAHRLLSSQTSQLEQAAAELFRRCDRLRQELLDQVRQMAELAERIQRSSEVAEDDNTDQNDRYEDRIARARDRQQKLCERYEALRRKVGRAGAGGKELSSTEKAWIREVTEMAAAYGIDSEMEVDGPETPVDNAISSRVYKVRDLAASFVEEAEELQKSQRVDAPSPRKSGLPRSPLNATSLSRMSDLGVPLKLQRAKVEEAMQMVEREAAVIEAVMARLERLTSQ